jgi:hypothetical protein
MTSGALQDVMHHLWRPLSTRAIAMAFRGEMGRESRNGQPLALARLPLKLTHVLDQVLLGWKVTIRLHSFDSFTAGAFSLPAQIRMLRAPVLDGGIGTYRSRPPLIVLVCPAIYSARCAVGPSGGPRLSRPTRAFRGRRLVRPLFRCVPLVRLATQLLLQKSLLKILNVVVESDTKLVLQ